MLQSSHLVSLGREVGVGDVVSARRDCDRAVVVDEELPGRCYIIHGSLHLRLCHAIGHRGVLAFDTQTVYARILRKGLNHCVEAAEAVGAAPSRGWVEGYLEDEPDVWVGVGHLSNLAPVSH